MALALLGLVFSGCVRATAPGAVTLVDPELDLKRDPPANFELEGAPFCFAGTNNYYLTYKPRSQVEDVLRAAQALDFRVLRLWGFIDIGSLDGSRRSVDDKFGTGMKDGVFFQYWDEKLGRPAFNEGENGLPRLDYALARAGELGLKVTVVLTNNWSDFGGMDQYLAWFGKTKHHEFYTDPRVKSAYKDWVTALVQRRNTVNGRVYRDDPTIFAWELANEPRCKGTGPAADGWTLETIPAWAGEMSAFIKSLDPNHMVAVGDEGFLNAAGEHWTYRANDGVDHEALTALPDIDFGTFHLYPDHWDTSFEWSIQYIADHARVARRLGKPSVLEEYGLKVSRDDQGRIDEGLDERLTFYQRWNESALGNGVNGSMAWLLAGSDGKGGRYPDYDAFTFYAGDETATLLAKSARRWNESAPACMSANGLVSQPASPFVRARRRERAVSGSSWVRADYLRSL